MALKNADLDRSTLSVCISLIENGVNPEALAVSTVRLAGTVERADAGQIAVRELQKDAKEVREQIVGDAGRE